MALKRGLRGKADQSSKKFQETNEILLSPISILCASIIFSVFAQNPSDCRKGLRDCEEEAEQGH